MKNRNKFKTAFLAVTIALLGCDDEPLLDVDIDNPVVALSVATQPSTVIYCPGESLDLTDLVASATFKDGTSKLIPLSEFEKNRITVAPAHDEVLEAALDKLVLTHATSKTTTEVALSFVSCEEKNPVTGISVKTLPTVVEYAENGTLNLAGLQVELSYESGEPRVVSYTDFILNGLVTSPVAGAALSEEDTVVTITYTASNKSVTFEIDVSSELYLPVTYPWPSAWPENNIYFITNFVEVDQIDGGSAKNTILSGAWVWAGGDLDNVNWAITTTPTYTFLNLPLKTKATVGALGCLVVFPGSATK